MSSGGAVLVVIFVGGGGNAWYLVSGVPDFHLSPSIHGEGARALFGFRDGSWHLALWSMLWLVSL
jgi:hypothetical protein